MPSPDINFLNIREHHNSQNSGFEELTRQLVLADPPDNCTSIENRGPGPDGGVEILVNFKDGRVWGWQAKYFPNSFSTSEVDQLKKSFKSALKNFPKLERYYVAIPRNLSGSSQEKGNNTQTKAWNTFKNWCANESAKLSRSVSIELWDETYFVSRLTRNDAIHSGMLYYWFDKAVLDIPWIKQKLELSLTNIGKRYRPDDHIEVSTAKTIQLLRRDSQFQNRLKLLIRNLDDAINDLQQLLNMSEINESLKRHIRTLLDLYTRHNEDLKKANPVEIDDPLLSETLSNLVSIQENNPSYNSLKNAIYEIKKYIINKSKTKKSYSEYIERKIISDIEILFKKIVEINFTFTKKEIRLLQEPILLLTGEAGTGKSHILADEAKKHLSSSAPAFFIPARIIDHGDKPEQEILDYLDLKPLNFDTLLAAIEAAALANGHPALFVIDGINESDNAPGWESGLPTLIKRIKKFRHIALCVSIRSSYKELCIRKGLDITTIPHSGFQANLGQAAKQYLDNKGIERPSAPIFGLREILYNPLFLSTAVDYMEEKKLVSFPRGLDTISSLITFWLEAIEGNLISKKFERIEKNDGKILKIIQKLALEMATSKSEYIPYEKAEGIAEDVIGLGRPQTSKDRILRRLIDEGVLLDFPSKDSGSGKRISFGFQKFSDYFIAEAIIRDCKTIETLANELNANGKYAYLFSKENYLRFTGIRIMLLALTPINFQKELPLVEKDFYKSVPNFITEFLESLYWRKGSDITQETVKLLEQLRDHKKELLINESSWFDLLLKTALLPKCPINAVYLKNYLASLSLGERDAKWSFYLVEKLETDADDWSITSQLIDWAWNAPKAEIEPEKVHLAAIVIALMTSTMDRQLRDCSTKALSSLLIKYPEEISSLIDEFADWNDSYVRERVLAAAAAGCLYCDKIEILKNAALAVDNMVFKKCPVEHHAWTRRYAQIIINHASFNNSGIKQDVKDRALPPYSSNQITIWPQVEQIEPLKEKAQSIYSSVVGLSRNPKDNSYSEFAGDFGCYTVTHISACFSEVPRTKSAPLTYKEEIKIFWNNVDALGKEIKLAHNKLIEANQKLSAITEALFMQRSNENKGSLTANNDNKQINTIENARTVVANAEKTFLKLLPSDFKKEYERLQPLINVVEKIPKFPILQARCWVFNRTLELGWKNNLHEKLDQKLRQYSYGRRDHKIERIGKKYQHIALAELTGYLADYHWYFDWNGNPCILTVLEDHHAPDIDPTYLIGSFGKSIETYPAEAIHLPKIAFDVDTLKNSMAWIETLDDIPDFTKFLCQSEANGYQWYLLKHLGESKDYMKKFLSEKPFKNAEYEIELILIEQSELYKLQELNSGRTNNLSHDIFDDRWPTPLLFGQRSYKYLPSTLELPLSYSIADLKFARIFEKFSSKNSDMDYSGVSEEHLFLTPHPALLSELKLTPKSAWSPDFLTKDGTLAFFNYPSGLSPSTFIRKDLLEEFAKKHDLKVVWKIWFMKNGGQNPEVNVHENEKFAKRDYLGFYYEDSGRWHGNMMPFND